MKKQRRNITFQKKGESYAGMTRKKHVTQIRSALTSQYCHWGAEGHVLGEPLTRSWLQGPQLSRNAML